MQLASVANVSLGHWGESEEAQIGSPCGSQRPGEVIHYTLYMYTLQRHEAQHDDQPCFIRARRVRVR